MSRRDERLQGTARLVRLGQDDGGFDREFWARIAPADRMAMVWEMTLEYLSLRDPDAPEPRLDRSVCRLERRYVKAG
jgi:hypothetical protein